MTNRNCEADKRTVVVYEDAGVLGPVVRVSVEELAEEDMVGKWIEDHKIISELARCLYYRFKQVRVMYGNGSTDFGRIKSNNKTVLLAATNGSFDNDDEVFKVNVVCTKYLYNIIGESI